MSGFIANGTAPPAPDITNGGFWPVVKPDEIRARMRLDGSIAPDRLRAAVVAAILMVNDDLVLWRAKQEAAGFATLADVPAEKVDGTSRLVLLYQRAIACCTAAELTERYRSYDASDSANQRADDLTPSIDELRRDQRWAIRDLKGESRVTVELI